MKWVLESGNGIDGFAVLRVCRWILRRLEAIFSSDLSEKQKNKKGWWLEKKEALENFYVDKISNHCTANIHLCFRGGHSWMGQSSFHQFN